MNDPFGVSKGWKDEIAYVIGAGNKAAIKANKYLVKPKPGNNTFPKRVKSTRGYQKPSTASLAPGEEARAVPSGMGNKQGQILISNKLNKGKLYRAQTVEHERAHLRPKRNSATFNQRMINPTRHGREEARASYLSGSSRSSYPKRQEPAGFKEGFDEVYTKMTNAGTKKRVRKSLEVSKKDKTNQAAAALAGGAVGQGAYQAAGYVPKWALRSNTKVGYAHNKKYSEITDPKIKTRKKTWEKAKKTQAKRGLSASEDPKFWRTLPKEVHGSKFLRTTGWTHGGKTGVATGTAATVAGTLIGIKKEKK